MFRAHLSPLRDINWNLCWKAWINIGHHKTKFLQNSTETNHHTQPLLTGFVQIFLKLFPLIETTFRGSDVEQLGKVLCNCAEVSYVGMDMDCSGGQINHLQKSVLDALAMVKETTLTKQNPSLIPNVFGVYLELTRNALSNLKNNKHHLFADTCIEELGNYYELTCDRENVINDNILPKIVHVLAIPLEVRYLTDQSVTWRVSISALIKTLRKGFPLCRAHPDKFQELWNPLAKVLANFLFPESTEYQKQEDRMADEAIDCHVIELLREEILPYPKVIPSKFIREIVLLLNKGSIHSSISLTEDCSGNIGLREDFARQSFETLLEFSLLDTNIGGGDSSSGIEGTSLTNKLAITSLLQRFKDVLQDAIEGEKLNRNIPLKRQKSAEISFVLKAIATVISSMKKAKKQKIDAKTWDQVISLFPYLVQFTETSSPQICNSVKCALLEYGDLLKPLE